MSVAPATSPRRRSDDFLCGQQEREEEDTTGGGTIICTTNVPSLPPLSLSSIPPQPHPSSSEQLIETAKQRWLLTTELIHLLTPTQTPLHLSTHPPQTPPSSGTLFLYNRKKTRFYRNDGHSWVKKSKTSTQIREDRVRLRVGGVLRVVGWYAHGEDVTTFHRRSYHLMDNPPRTNDTAAEEESTKKGRQNDLILVHYLDTAKASGGLMAVDSSSSSTTFLQAQPSSSPPAASSSRLLKADAPTSSAVMLLDPCPSLAGGGEEKKEVDPPPFPPAGGGGESPQQQQDDSSSGSHDNKRWRRKVSNDDTSPSKNHRGGSDGGCEQQQQQDADRGREKEIGTDLEEKDDTRSNRIEDISPAVDEMDLEVEGEERKTNGGGGLLVGENENESSMTPFDWRSIAHGGPATPGGVGGGRGESSGGGGAVRTSSSSVFSLSSLLSCSLDDFAFPDDSVLVGGGGGDTITGGGTTSSNTNNNNLLPPIPQEVMGGEGDEDIFQEEDDERGQQQTVSKSVDHHHGEIEGEDGAVLPELVRFMPDRVPLPPTATIYGMEGGSTTTTTKTTTSKIMIAFAGNLPPLPPHRKIMGCRRYAAFVDIAVNRPTQPSTTTPTTVRYSATGNEDNPDFNRGSNATPHLSIRRVALSPVIQLNSGTYECDTPQTITQPGHRAVVLVGIAKADETPMHWLEQSVRQQLQRLCDDIGYSQRAMIPPPTTSPTEEQLRNSLRPILVRRETVDVYTGIRVLTQLSRDFLEFYSTTQQEAPSQTGGVPPLDGGVFVAGGGGPPAACPTTSESSAASSLTTPSMNLPSSSSSYHRKNSHHSTDVVVATTTTKANAGAAVAGGGAGPMQPPPPSMTTGGGALFAPTQHHHQPTTKNSSHHNPNNNNHNNNHPHLNLMDQSSTTTVEQVLLVQQPAEEMSALTSWTTAPRFEQCDEVYERTSLSFEDMSTALADVHGVSAKGLCNCRDYLSNNDIKLLDSLIENHIPLEKKRALLYVKEKNPSLLGKELKLLFLATNESYDSLVAAEKYCRHWDMRLEVFGEEKILLPLTLDGALKDDMTALTEVDFLHPLPGSEDKFGRSLVWLDCGGYFPSLHDRKSTLRAIWYMYDVANREAANPTKGLVLVKNMSRTTLLNMDKDLARDIYRLLEVFPCNLRAHHYINPPWFHNLLFPTMRLFMGRDLRQRNVFHRGSPQEISKSLARYGVLPSQTPPGASGGGFDFDLVEYVRGRKERGL